MVPEIYIYIYIYIYISDTEQTEVVPPEFEMSCRLRPLTQQRVHDFLSTFHDYIPPCTVTAKCCDCTGSDNQPRVLSRARDPTIVIKTRKRKSTIDALFRYRLNREI